MKKKQHIILMGAKYVQFADEMRTRKSFDQIPTNQPNNFQTRPLDAFSLWEGDDTLAGQHFRFYAQIRRDRRGRTVE